MIDIKKVFKQTVKFNVVSIISALIQIPTQIIIGVFLLPEEFGIISLISLWSLYSGLINPGMLSAGQREIPYLIGKKNIEQSLKVQNVSISSDLIYSILPFLVIICSSYFYSNKIIKIGLIITAFYFIINKLPTYWSSINFANQKFSVVASGRLIGVICSPIIIICFIYLLGIYAVLMAPLISAIITGVYYLIKGPINYSFKLEWKEIIRLIRIGFVFSLSGVIFYGYKMADSTIIASFLPLNDLGLFSFAMALIMFGINFLADFGRVLEPIIWEHFGKVDNEEESFENIKNIIIYTAIFTAMLIPFAQIGYGVVVKLIVPKYLLSFPLFIILSSMLYLAMMPTIPNIILNSVIVNKQKYVTLVYALGLSINIILNILAIKVGYGIKTIAFITIGSQGLITIILFILSSKYILNKIDNIKIFVFYTIFPFIIFVMFSFSHYYLNNIILNNWYFVCISLFLQIIVWGIVILIIYKEYFPKKEIIFELKNIINRNQ